MSLNSLPSSPQSLLNGATLAAILGELQGLTFSVVPGAAAGTAMAVAAIRPEDTIKAAIKFVTAGGAPADDTANITIQPTKATGTLTITGNPVEGETLVVNDGIYTFRAVPVLVSDVKIVAGDNNAMAANLAKAINAYEGRYESRLKGDGYRTAGVSAASVNNVVTVSSLVDGLGTIYAVTSSGSTLAVGANNTASPTLTAATVAAGNTFTVGGITFTAAASPTLDTQFAVKGTNNDQAAEVARAINAYEFKYGTLGVKATAAAAVVTLAPNKPKAGNAITLTEAATNVAASGSGFLAGGTNTGSIKSTTDLTGSTLLLVWFNKR